jgi:hypothetical protein
MCVFLTFLSAGLGFLTYVRRIELVVVGDNSNSQEF